MNLNLLRAPLPKELEISVSKLTAEEISASEILVGLAGQEYKLPDQVGAIGEILKVDAFGNLSFQPDGGGVVYDQDLNTFNDVKFSKLTVDSPVPEVVITAPSLDRIKFISQMNGGVLYMVYSKQSIPGSSLLYAVSPDEFFIFTPSVRCAANLLAPVVTIGSNPFNVYTLPLSRSGIADYVMVSSDDDPVSWNAVPFTRGFFNFRDYAGTTRFNFAGVNLWTAISGSSPFSSLNNRNMTQVGNWEFRNDGATRVFKLDASLSLRLQNSGPPATIEVAFGIDGIESLPSTSVSRVDDAATAFPLETSMTALLVVPQNSTVTIFGRNLTTANPCQIWSCNFTLISV